MSAAREVLEPGKKAAIGGDEPRGLDKDITQISAKEFLTALDAQGLGASSLQLLPEKKKLELHLEPEWTRDVKVKDLVRVLASEKKKVEMELPLDLGAHLGRNGGFATRRGAGSVGYPAPDGDDDGFPPHIEMRKTMLDTLVRQYVQPALNAQTAALESAVRGIHARLEQLEGRIGK
jgi:hypothetical protein